MNEQLARSIISVVRYQTSSSVLSNPTIWRWKIALNLVSILQSKEAFFKMILLAKYLRENNGKGISAFVESSDCKFALSQEKVVKQEVDYAIQLIKDRENQSYKIGEIFELWG